MPAKQTILHEDIKIKSLKVCPAAVLTALTMLLAGPGMSGERSREKKVKGPKAQGRVKKVKGPRARRNRRSS